MFGAEGEAGSGMKDNQQAGSGSGNDLKELAKWA